MAEVTKRTRASNRDLLYQDYGDFKIIQYLGKGCYLLRCKKCKNEITRFGTSLKKKTAVSLCKKCNGGDILTIMENTVGKLVAQGMTNKQVSAQLSIGERTVQTHLQNIFAKLGISNRYQLIVYMNKQEAK